MAETGGGASFPGMLRAQLSTAGGGKGGMCFCCCLFGKPGLTGGGEGRGPLQPAG